MTHLQPITEADRHGTAPVARARREALVARFANDLVLPALEACLAKRSDETVTVPDRSE